MKLLIAGSRGYTNYIVFKQRIDSILKEIDKKEVTIVSGGARGVDTMAVKYATENNIPFIEVLADWDKYGKSAGFKRNRQMAGMVTHAIIFWDGESTGTKNMIDLCKEFNITLRKIMVKKE